MKATFGDVGAYPYATIRAQWGNGAQALEWLDTAMRLRDAGLELVKTDNHVHALLTLSRCAACLARFPQIAMLHQRRARPRV
jgi:hypothetical protein